MGGQGVKHSTHIEKGQLQVESIRIETPASPHPQHHELTMQGNSLSSGGAVAQKIGPPHGPNPTGNEAAKLALELDITSPAQISFEPKNVAELHQLKDVVLAIYENNRLVYTSKSYIGSGRFDPSTLGPNKKAVLALDEEGVKAANHHFKPSNFIALYTRFADGKEHPLAFTVRKLPNK